MSVVPPSVGKRSTAVASPLAVLLAFVVFSLPLELPAIHFVHGLFSDFIGDASLLFRPFP